jgi:hypothetical protein
MDKSLYLPSQHKSMLTVETVRKMLEARKNFKTVFYNIESTPFDVFRRINDLYAVSGKNEPK